MATRCICSFSTASFRPTPRFRSSPFPRWPSTRTPFTRVTDARSEAPYASRLPFSFRDNETGGLSFPADVAEPRLGGGNYWVALSWGDIRRGGVGPADVAFASVAG